jgi:hypothetical protein
MALPVHLDHAHQLKLASLVHGGGQEELEKYKHHGRVKVARRVDGGPKLSTPACKLPC